MRTPGVSRPPIRLATGAPPGTSLAVKLIDGSRQDCDHRQPRPSIPSKARRRAPRPSVRRSARFFRVQPLEHGTTFLAGQHCEEGSLLSTVPGFQSRVREAAVAPLTSSTTESGRALRRLIKLAWSTSNAMTLDWCDIGCSCFWLPVLRKVSRRTAFRTVWGAWVARWPATAHPRHPPCLWPSGPAVRRRLRRRSCHPRITP
jgi:hypothetical protein